MEKVGKPQVDLIIGIDFGTTRSAITYRFTKTNEGADWANWPDSGVGASKIKGPTVSLYTKEGKAVAFGHTAIKKYGEVVKDKSHVLIREFKLQLTEKKVSGIPIETVVSDYLIYLKTSIDGVIKNKTGQYISSYKTRWCLTIPAIWTEQEKKLMRKAAHLAGLTKTADESDELILVLEPEAAAAHFVENATNIIPSLGKIENLYGKTVVVVDGGGGTIDLTAHIIKEDSLKEFCEGVGNRVGSNHINNLFRLYFHKQFEKGSFSEWQNTKEDQWFKILSELEKFKCSKDSFQDIKLPVARSLASVKRTSNEMQLISDDDETCVVLKANEMKQFYQKSLTETQNLIEEIFENAKKRGIEVNYVYLVGGFSCSKIFQDAVIEKVNKRASVYWPNDPEAAIVRGALKFGISPDYITERVVRATYGLQVRTLWNDKKHVGKTPVYVNGIKYCPGVFSVLVEKGESKSFNSSIKTVYATGTERAVVCFLETATFGPSIPYFVDNTMKVLGKFIIEIPFIEDTVDVHLYFGKTDIVVEANATSNPNTIYKLTLEQ